MCLIKPQFEAGREKVGKKGVVRDIKVHHEVVEQIVEFSKEHGLKPLHLEFSPIKGPEGNIEYLLHEKANVEPDYVIPFSIDEVIRKSHETL